MFEAAVTKFAKAVGDNVLIPVPSLTDADKCDVLNVVVKKNRRWFWQSPKYEPSTYKLHNILRENVAECKDITESELLPEYKKTNKFAFTGKLGAKLKHLWELETKTKDSFDLETNFTKIQKTEVQASDAADIVNGK